VSADDISEISKRLAEAKNQPTVASVKTKIDHALQEGAPIHLTRQIPTPGSTTSPPSESEPSPVLIPTPPSPAALIGRDTFFFPQPALSVYGALFDNGRILGLSCSCTTAYRSKPASPTIPKSLIRKGECLFRIRDRRRKDVERAVGRASGMARSTPSSTRGMSQG
jgi:hypothetical protein